MITKNEILFHPLGQSGYEMVFNNLNVFFDPYISNFVEKNENQVRLYPNNEQFFGKLEKADYVFISHSHPDHCDFETLKNINWSISNLKIITSANVKKLLINYKIPENKISIPIMEKFNDLDQFFDYMAIDSAHPNHSYTNDLPDYLGFIFKINNKIIYHAGDTKLTNKLISQLKKIKIDYAFLPVNEHNYFKQMKGIVGNMSIYDAFSLADYLEIDNVIPTHWDMFKDNSVNKNEIELIYENGNYKFNLIFYPNKI